MTKPDAAGTTRFAIDARTALRIIRDEPGLDRRVALVGPAVLRSHALQLLYDEVRDGSLERAEGRDLLEGVATLKVRLLGDRVSRATAWRIAFERDLVDPAIAEYVAVAQLQADVLVAADPAVIAAAEGLVPLADWGELRRAQGRS